MSKFPELFHSPEGLVLYVTADTPKLTRSQPLEVIIEELGNREEALEGIKKAISSGLIKETRPDHYTVTSKGRKVIAEGTKFIIKQDAELG